MRSPSPEFIVTARASTPEEEPCPECYGVSVFLETGYRVHADGRHISGVQYQCAACGWLASEFPVH